MDHLFAQPHPKNSPRISRQITSVQEDLHLTYEILTQLYQFPDQILIKAGFAEPLNDFHRNLNAFVKSCEILSRSVSKDEFNSLDESYGQELPAVSSYLNEGKKESRHAKKRTNQLAASFCRIRLGIRDIIDQGINNNE